MMAVLEDGLPHYIPELHACLNDELGSLTNIRPHIFALRRRLEPHGLSINTQKNGAGTYYRLVRLLASATDGKR